MSMSKRNEVVANILGALVIVLMILAVGFIEEAWWWSVVCLALMSACAWCINQIWVDDEE